MDYEKYYGPGNYRQLLIAESMLRSIAYDLQNENKSHEIQPIINYSTRIKSPESMINKLIDRGFDSSAESALSNVFDAVGLRIVCSFESDVYNIVKK